MWGVVWRGVLVCVVGVVLWLGVGVGVGVVWAGGLVPWWGVSVGSRPSDLVRGEIGQIIVTAENRGDASTGGEVRLVGVLPAGLTAVGIKGRAGEVTGVRGPVVCVLKTLSCSFAGVLHPYEEIEMVISVVVEAGASSGEVASASVSGGGAVGVVSGSHAILVGGEERFGFEEFSLVPENVGGSVDTQAGSHPFQLSTVVTFNQTAETFNKASGKNEVRDVALPRDVISELPAGLVGNPTPFAQCTDAQFANVPVTPGGQTINECPAEAAVGVATVTYDEPNASGFNTVTAPIFNMKALAGEPARFGFKALGIVSAFLNASVRTGGDYGVDVSSSNILQLSWVLSVKLTFWGVPGDPRHDSQRGWECLEDFGTCSPPAGSPPPLLSLPTSCEGAFASTIRGDSWASSATPAQQAQPVTFTLPEAIDGCDRLPFDPSVRVTPDTPAASSPMGLNVDVHVPQSSILDAEGLAQSAVRDITVALPEGVSVNPAGGDGLQACSEPQVGYLAGESSPGRELFTPGLPEPFCPDASKIATVKIKLPILPNPVEGALYLATQNENPFGSLIALYLVAQDPVSGVLVKLAGETQLTATGQLIGSFKNSPQAPFEDAEIHFFGGERAPLASPAHCGTYTTNATFTPWSGNQPVPAESHFEVTSGPNASACPGASLPFTPTLTAGSTNIQAGALTPFTSTITREDGNQALGAVQLHMPPGLSGLLTSVKLCPENQANEGSCPPQSLIGETTVSAGVGSDPVTVTGGRVYITEKYEGAPFGLSIVNPVKAGPFDLENTPQSHPPCDCIIVRAKIEINPATAELTVTTNPAGQPYSIPSIIQGIPVQIKHVNVTINRPGFTFNPTNCRPLHITATITSQENTLQAQTVPFQAANCATLAFAPKLHFTTNGQTSKQGGASLTTKLTYPNTPFGTQTNIAQIKVSLPKALPSRLTTLQKACLAKTFETNPSACPAGSIVGHATAITPLLPVPLQGPAYFVSHGGEAFPSLTMVLQGYGITIDLVGTTFINKHGITSSTFKTIPDQPVTSFELTLPQGPNSALAANTNLCNPKLKLTIPTTYTAQNNTQKTQNTPITTLNCPKHKHTTKHTKTHKTKKK